MSDPIKEAVERSICRHERLGFASGGFYVQCADCHAQWVARKPTFDLDLDYDRSANGLSMHDERTDPSTCRERVKALEGALKGADDGLSIAYALLSSMVASPFWKEAVDPVRDEVEAVTAAVRQALQTLRQTEGNGT